MAWALQTTDVVDQLFLGRVEVGIVPALLGDVPLEEGKVGRSQFVLHGFEVCWEMWIPFVAIQDECLKTLHFGWNSPESRRSLPMKGNDLRVTEYVETRIAFIPVLSP